MMAGLAAAPLRNGTRNLNIVFCDAKSGNNAMNMLPVIGAGVIASPSSFRAAR